MSTVAHLRTIAPPPQRARGMEATIPQDVATQRLAAGLRLYVGRGEQKPYSVAMIADATGISASAIEKYMAGDATPGLANALTLFAVLGPAFVNHLIEPAGLTGVRRLDPVAKAAADVMSDLAGETARFAKALADGRIDHVERAELRRTLPALIETLTDLQAELGKDSA